MDVLLWTPFRDHAQISLCWPRGIKDGELVHLVVVPLQYGACGGKRVAVATVPAFAVVENNKMVHGEVNSLVIATHSLLPAVVNPAMVPNLATVGTLRQRQL